MLFDHLPLPATLFAHDWRVITAKVRTQITWMMVQVEEVSKPKAAPLRRGHGHSKAAGANQGRALRLEGRAAAKRAGSPEPFYQVTF